MITQYILLLEPVVFSCILLVSRSIQTPASAHAR